MPHCNEFHFKMPLALRCLGLLIFCGSAIACVEQVHEPSFLDASPELAQKLAAMQTVGLCARQKRGAPPRQSVSDPGRAQETLRGRKRSESQL